MSFSALASMSSNSKTAGHRVKFRDSGIVAKCIWCPFDLKVLKIILGSFGGVWTSVKMASNLKTSFRRAKKMKFGTQIETLVKRVWGTFHLQCSSSFWEIWCTCLKMACNSKTAVQDHSLRMKRSENWYSRVVVTFAC